MPNDINLLTIFVTGLLTGGLSCVAVQGGLLASSLVQDKQNLIKTGKNKFVQVLAFIFSKLIAYSILGFMLGFAGSIFQVSLQLRILLYFAVIIFMLGTAFNLLGVHPLFRYFVIVPPSWLTRRVYKQSENKRLFAPVLLGFLTVFIPCGATQAIMALSVSSASPVQGAVIMFIFVLGTSPLFFLLGFATLRLGATLNKKFISVAAFAIIFLSLFNLDAALALSNSPVTIRSTINRGFCIISYCDDSFGQLVPVTQETIIFTPSGYSPNRFAVRRGEKITLQLVNQNAQGCIQSFTISALNVQKIVLPDSTETITFRAPEEPGRITFTCSSGLYPGTIEVI